MSAFWTTGTNTTTSNGRPHDENPDEKAWAEDARG